MESEKRKAKSESSESVCLLRYNFVCNMKEDVLHGLIIEYEVTRFTGEIRGENEESKKQKTKIGIES